MKLFMNAVFPCSSFHCQIPSLFIFLLLLICLKVRCETVAVMPENPQKTYESFLSLVAEADGKSATKSTNNSGSPRHVESANPLSLFGNVAYKGRFLSKSRQRRFDFPLLRVIRPNSHPTPLMNVLFLLRTRWMQHETSQGTQKSFHHHSSKAEPIADRNKGIVEHKAASTNDTHLRTQAGFIVSNDQTMSSIGLIDSSSIPVFPVALNSATNQGKTLRVRHQSRRKKGPISSDVQEVNFENTHSSRRRSWNSSSRRDDSNRLKEGELIDVQNKELTVNPLNHLKSNRRALVITNESHLRKDWCRTEPLKQKVREKGCVSKTIVNHFCYGQCNSFYIPRNPGRAGGKSSSAFQSCAFCKPNRMRWINVRLECPGKTPPFRRKRVQVVDKCRCLSEILR